MSISNLELKIGSEATAEKAIQLRVVDHVGGMAKILFEIVWLDAELKEWLSANRESILSEEIPLFAPKSSCIAESVARFYDKEPDPSDAEFDAMHAYRTRHGFRFALRGVDIPDVYVGLFEGRHQVSVLENGRPFCAFVSLEGVLGSYACPKPPEDVRS